MEATQRRYDWYGVEGCSMDHEFTISGVTDVAVVRDKVWMAGSGGDKVTQQNWILPDCGRTFQCPKIKT